MKRVTGILLAAFGVLALLTAATSFLIVPKLAHLPSQGALPTVVLESFGATVMPVGAGAVPQPVKADLRTTVETKPDGTTDGGAVIWNVTQQTVLVGSGTPMSALQTKVALDARTGAAVDWSGQCMADPPAQCQPGNAKFSGQLYAFPFGTQQKSYQFFDTTLRTALPIAYSGTETVSGLRAYRFEQTVPEQQMTVDPRLLAGLVASLPPQAQALAAGASVRYQSTRTVWVEPTTGTIINYREHQQRFVTLAPGQRIPLLDADFQYTPQTRAAIAARASDGVATIRALRWYLPIGLAVVGLAALAIGLLLLRRRATSACVSTPAGRSTEESTRAGSTA